MSGCRRLIRLSYSPSVTFICSPAARGFPARYAIGLTIHRLIYQLNALILLQTHESIRKKQYIFLNPDWVFHALIPAFYL
jgi:hypothetical protein